MIDKVIDKVIGDEVYPPWDLNPHLLNKSELYLFELGGSAPWILPFGSPLDADINSMVNAARISIKYRHQFHG